MGAFGYLQLLVDFLFAFLILLLVVGRSWRRGAGAPADQEAYRDMISTLGALIREMKDGVAEMDQRLEAKRGEIEQAIAAADIRLQQIEAAMLKSGPVSSTVSSSPPLQKSGGQASRRTASAMPKSAAILGDETVKADRAGTPPGEAAEMDDDERREKYRQALDFARKGWSVVEIARHTRLPRGEIELLIRTKGQGA